MTDRRKVKFPGFVDDGRQFLGYFCPRNTRELHSVSIVRVGSRFRIFGETEVVDTLEEVKALILSKW